MILLIDEEILKVAEPYVDYDYRVLDLDRAIAKAQLKKMVDLLKQKTIPAWGGNRIILDEDWKAILKEVE